MNPKISEYSQPSTEATSPANSDKLISEKSEMLQLYSLYFHQYQESTRQAQVQQAIYLFSNLVLALSMIVVSAFHPVNSVIISIELALVIVGFVTVWAWKVSSHDFVQERESQFRILIKIEEQLYGEGSFISQWARAGEFPYRNSPVPLFGLKNLHFAFFFLHGTIASSTLFTAINNMFITK